MIQRWKLSVLFSFLKKDQKLIKIKAKILYVLLPHMVILGTDYQICHGYK